MEEDFDEARVRMADVEDVDINEKTVKEVKVTGKTRHNPLADENNTYG